jgi:hypothetical protein
MRATPSGLIDHLKALPPQKRVNPGNTEFIYIYPPLPFEPDEREDRFGEAIDVELRLKELGYVSGGGSLLSEENPDGSHDIEWCCIDVDATDVSGARALLRQLLPSLDCPVGTAIQYRQAGRPRQDEFDGAKWQIDRPRETTHLGL